MTAPMSDLAAVIQRLDNLEQQNHRLTRQNRWLKCGGIGIACLLASGLLMAADDASKPKVLEADQLVLRDARGKPRILLGSNKDGAGLLVYDAAGKRRVGFVVDANGAVLRLRDPDGKVRSGISVEKGGIGMVRYDNQDKPQAGPNAILELSTVLLKDDALSKFPDPKAEP